MKRLGWLGAFVVVASLGACGKSDGGSGPVPLSELPARAAAIACEGLGSCCQSSGFAFDVATCKRLYTAEIEGELSEFDRNLVEYDADMAGKCLDSFAAETRCGDLEGDDRYCDRIFRGKLGLGQPCMGSEECREEEGQYVSCYSPDGIEPEVCTLTEERGPLPRGKLGDACTSTCDEDDDCLSGGAIAPGGPGAPVPQEPVACYRADGLWCDTGSCAQLLDVGAPCPGYDGCKGQAFCDFQSQICTLPRKNGEPCQGRNECQSGYCDYGDEGPTIDPVTASPVCAPANTVHAGDCVVDDESDSATPPSPAP